MSEEQRFGVWLPRVGWLLVAAGLVWFVAALHHRRVLEASSRGVIRMLFVPSVEQGTLVRRGDQLARFIRADSGLMLRSEVPTSYAAVIQAIGSGQADVAWVPAFAYVLAHARYGAEARLQVVRSYDLFGIVVGRVGPGQPRSLQDLAGSRIAFPGNLNPDLKKLLVQRLGRVAPGWVEVPAEDDKDAVRRLLDAPGSVDAAVSSHVFSGPHDLVGDGRKELEYDRPGTLEATRVLGITENPVPELTTTYNGCILTRTDSGINRLQDLNGRSFAFSDETSTSGHIFARALLNRAHVTLGHTFFAGGHPNVVQAVMDGKVPGGRLLLAARPARGPRPFPGGGRPPADHQAYARRGEPARLAGQGEDPGPHGPDPQRRVLRSQGVPGKDVGAVQRLPAALPEDAQGPGGLLRPGRRRRRRGVHGCDLRRLPGRAEAGGGLRQPVARGRGGQAAAAAEAAREAGLVSGSGVPAVRLDGVGKVFDGRIRALADVNLEVREGEFLVVLGLSGSASRRSCGASTA
jgi:ABC-type phosphate/phosphonate transport system, periplasmic component